MFKVRGTAMDVWTRTPSGVYVWLVLGTALTLASGVGNAYTLSQIWDDSENQGLTCWTCPNKTDNNACNDWAPDILCPTNHTVCKTVHQFEERDRRSVSVYKVCAQQMECTHDHVGCTESGVPGVKTCTSCCDQPYCNEMVPTNHSMAFDLSSVFANGGRAHKDNASYWIVSVCALLSLLWASGLTLGTDTSWEGGASHRALRNIHR